jgi:hypothetical protein
MFSLALKRHGQLCIGLYRLHDQAAPDSNKRYVITNPPAELRLLSSDYVSGLRPFAVAFLPIRDVTVMVDGKIYR